VSSAVCFRGSSEPESASTCRTGNNLFGSDNDRRDSGPKLAIPDRDVCPTADEHTTNKRPDAELTPLTGLHDPDDGIVPVRVPGSDEREPKLSTANTLTSVMTYLSVPIRAQGWTEECFRAKQMK
jgi:hypothetical protein